MHRRIEAVKEIVARIAPRPDNDTPFGRAKVPNVTAPTQQKLKLFSGRANRPLAERIARELATIMKIELGVGRLVVDDFPDGETNVRIDERWVIATASASAASLGGSLRRPSVTRTTRAT